ncbi:MAG: hypothetical protein DRJ38_08535 [Thermoprotei archaeon]|nr:MAG: hypothetical protein DRJ38_08535 [Thermoprotei archaeon]
MLDRYFNILINLNEYRMKRYHFLGGKTGNSKALAGNYQRVLKTLLNLALIFLVLGVFLSVARITEIIVIVGVWILLLSPLISLLALAVDLAKRDKDSFYLTLLILTLLLVNIILLRLGL